MCIKSMLIDQFVCLENIQIHVTKILLYVHVNIVREGGGFDAGERDGEWRGGGSYQNHVYGHGGSCLEIIKFTFERFLGSFFFIFCSITLYSQSCLNL